MKNVRYVFALQSKHPHVIYEYTDKSPQGCAVATSNFGNMSGRKRRSADEEDRGHSHAVRDPAESLRAAGLDDFLHLVKSGGKAKRDVRTVQKFIELALVLDKAFVSSETPSESDLEVGSGPFPPHTQFELRRDSSRKDVIHDAIQVANIADLVSSSPRS